MDSPDPIFEAGDVWAAADEVTTWVLDGSLLRRRISASDLGSGHSWSVTRVKAFDTLGAQVTEIWTGTVPAWKVETSTDFSAAPGVSAVTESVRAMVPSVQGLTACCQSATASYTATGFEATAVRTLDFMGGADASDAPTRKVRRVSLVFGHPHVVVAVARGGAWEGVPLIHAWVDGSTDLDHRVGRRRSA